nr:hypothetical protein [Mastigocladopsis repens]
MIAISTFTAGTEVRITGGTHKGKKGTVTGDRPEKKTHQGKIAVRLGAAGNKSSKIAWIESSCLGEVTEARQEKDSEDELVTQKQDQDFELTPSKQQLLAYLAKQDKPIHAMKIANDLDWSLFITERRLGELISHGYVSQSEDDYKICNQLEQSDSLKESAGSLVHQNSLEGSNGSNQSKLMETPSGSCDRTIPIPFTQISETTTPKGAQPIASSADFPAQTPHSFM